jgi:lipoprotein-releasing system permease protein
MSSLIFTIAMRFLRSKRKEAFISVVSGFSLIGIALGVATLIVVMSVMNGYHKEFLKNILGIQGHITIASRNHKVEDYVNVSDEIERIKNIQFTAPIIIEQGLVVSKNGTSGAVMRGIDPEKLALKPLIKDAVADCDLAALRTGGGIILGEALARSIGVSRGDDVKIVIPNSSSTVVGNIPKSKTFKVIATFDIGLYQYNSTTVFMNLEDAQKLFKYGNSVSEIEIIVDNQKSLEQVKSSLFNQFGSTYAIVDWEMSQAKWLNALAVERNVMFFILTLIILVAVFNIISSLIMLVKDKSKAIAILRTMGMSRSEVVQIFVIAGSFIGFLGSTIGVIIGSLFAMNIDNLKVMLESLTGKTLFDPVVYFLSHLPSDVYFSDIISIFLMSLVFSILSTIYPSFRAANMRPIEVLPYE